MAHRQTHRQTLATGTIVRFNRRMNRFVRTALIIIGLSAVIWFVIAYYPFIFSKTVSGEIVAVERVTEPSAVIGGNLTAAQMYSFAIAIREEKTGTIYTASTEDRKWAVAKKGFCASVILYPYAPWQLGKSGEYFNARLDELRDCNNLLGKAVETNPQSAPVDTPAAIDPVPAATP